MSQKSAAFKNFVYCKLLSTGSTCFGCMQKNEEIHIKFVERLKSSSIQRSLVCVDDHLIPREFS